MTTHFPVGTNVYTMIAGLSVSGRVTSPLQIIDGNEVQYVAFDKIQGDSGGGWQTLDHIQERFMPQPRRTIRGDVLLEAKDLIEGDRNITYGTPTENFTNIANMWNILFGYKLDEPFTPADVAQAMIALKLCRNITDGKRDTYIDIAGYAACGWEALESAK